MMQNEITYTVGGIILSEVNLFITDMVMAAVAFYCYTKTPATPLNKPYALFFLFTGLSALGAGFGHLFTFYTGVYLKVAFWIFSLLANYCIIEASIRRLVTLSTRKMLHAVSVIKGVAALILLGWFQHFSIITVDSVISIALISLPVHYYQWKQTQHNGYKLFCYGIVFTMLTAVVGGFKLSVSDAWFNHKDLNHLIICGGMLWMYNGIRQLSPGGQKEDL